MKDWLRFACAYWHSFTGSGADPFGEPTHLFPGTKGILSGEQKDKADAAFWIYYQIRATLLLFSWRGCGGLHKWHCRNDKRLQVMTKYLKQNKKKGVKLFWGTANLFSNKRYMNGAATNPDFHRIGSRRPHR